MKTSVRAYAAILASVATVGLLFALLVETTVVANAAPKGKATTHAVGQTVENFLLQNGSQIEVALDDFKDKSIVVLFSIGVDCPVSKRHLQEIKKLEKEYAPRGVQVLAIDSNPGRMTADLASLARTAGITFPILLDADQGLAKSLKVERAAEALLLDAQRVVRYHGRVDDRFADPTKPTDPTRRDLLQALDELLAGKDVRVATTSSTGCPIARPIENPVPYTPESVRRGRGLYLSSCADCHSFDGTGEDSDVTDNAPDLTDVSTWASDGSPAATFTAIRDGLGDEMPPFKDDFRDEKDIWHMVNFIRSLQK